VPVAKPALPATADPGGFHRDRASVGGRQAELLRGIVEGGGDAGLVGNRVDCRDDVVALVGEIGRLVPAAIAPSFTPLILM
jgi:hypothetical protein